MTNPYRQLPVTQQAKRDTSASSVVIPFNRTSVHGIQTPRERAITDIQQPLRRALTAASKKINPSNDNTNIAYGHRNRPAEWQNEAWAIADQVGEVSFVCDLFANGLSQLRLEPARKDPQTKQMIRLCDLKTDDLTETDKLVQTILDDFTSDQDMAEMQRIWGVQRSIVGEALFVGLPMTSSQRPGRPRSRKQILDYTWHIYSRADVTELNGVMRICGVEYNPDDVVVIRVWQPSPRLSLQAWSPMRSLLPVLRELVGLTMHVSSQIDSKLAGAGILLLPTSATVMGSTPPEDDQEEDPTVAAIMEAMITPIKDRDSAAAIVPLIMTAPDDSVDKIRHISFSNPLDGEAKNLRDEAIRRIALGFSMPPEQLLGLGHASHWSAWLVAEDTVRYQFVPAMKPFVDALLVQFIHPILVESGVDEALAASYGFTIESDALIQRPNKFDEAFEMYKVDAIQLSALLEAGGFRQTDAPEKEAGEDRAVDIALKAVGINPSLYFQPGLPAIVSQVRAVLAGQDASNAPASALPPEMGTENPNAQAAPHTPEPGPKESNTKPTSNGDNRPGPPKSTDKGPDKN